MNGIYTTKDGRKRWREGRKGAPGPGGPRTKGGRDLPVVGTLMRMPTVCLTWPRLSSARSGVGIKYSKRFICKTGPQIELFPQYMR